MEELAIIAIFIIIGILWWIKGGDDNGNDDNITNIPNHLRIT